MNKVKWNHRPPRIKDILYAQELRRTTALSIREISRAVLKREDPKTIHRWLNTNVSESYPQVDISNI